MSDFELNKIYQANSLTDLKFIPDKIANCCVTSPPYWQQRDYNENGQIGLEKTLNEYIDKIVCVFQGIKRILKDDGTLWINLGDGYARNGGNGTDYGFKHSRGYRLRNNKVPAGYKKKDLLGIPWQIAFALRDDGWYLRQDIIWHKPNPMPESINDRCTKAHEYIFLLSKNPRYYYDQEAIKEKASTNTHARLARAKLGQKSNPDTKINGIRPPKAQNIKSGIIKNNESYNQSLINIVETRNKRSVWTIAPEPSSDEHYAAFPQKLIVDCIKAGCPPNGIVIDPFMGKGTTAVVSRKLERNFIGLELKEQYINMANRWLYDELGLFI